MPKPKYWRNSRDQINIKNYLGGTRQGGLFGWFMRQEGTIYGFKKVIWSENNSELAKVIKLSIDNELTGLHYK